MVELGVAVALARSELLFALAVGFALTKRNARLMVAESCTGGLVNHWLTSIAGSSHWFDGGVITYSNAVKMSLLGVRSATLHLYGAVSAQTAMEMADGMRRRHRSALAEPSAHVPDALYAIAITGIAGPQGASPGKPVGWVHVAWTGPSGVESNPRQFVGERSQIQAQAAAFALIGLFGRLCRSTG